jgi:NADPH-dependent 2,4-dienoyl-CoA reductase/sulfur reductase-like enzyme
VKAGYHILVTRAETIGAFNTGFDTANLHRPTSGRAARDARHEVVVYVVVVFSHGRDPLAGLGRGALSAPSCSDA